MKKLLVFSILTLLITSCHKREKNNKECNGVFIGARGWTSGPYTLAEVSPNTGEILSEYGTPFNFSGYTLTNAFNHTTKDYYKLEIDRDVILHKCNLVAKSRKTYTYDGSAGTRDDILLANSATNKLYLLALHGKQNRFFELSLITETLPTDNYCTEREFYTIDTQKSLTSPFIDETTGLIYFMYGSQLRKVDPSNGASSIVTTYSDVLPDELYYNNTDKMAYGIDRKSIPFSFIKLDPQNGTVVKLSQLSFLDPIFLGKHTYDPCNNLYVISDTNTYFISPQNGKVVKQFTKTAFGDYPYFEK